METRFIHKVSKGSRYNQIYIPGEINMMFEIGDIVEVKLLKKKSEIYYSTNLSKLSDFKEKLIKEMFSFLSKYKEIKQVIIFGSFLTKKIDYNDIDVMIMVEKENEKFDKKVYDDLIDKFNLKFHILSVEKEKLEHELKISPIIRGMLYHFVSNKKYEFSKERKIDVNYLKFMLMLPEDLLKIDLDRGRIYYDSLRRLIGIEYFLKNDEISPLKIDEIIESMLDNKKFKSLVSNEPVDKKILKELKKVIKIKLNIINRLLKNGEK